MKKYYINLFLLLFIILISTDYIYSKDSRKKDTILLGYIQDTEDTDWKKSQAISVKKYARDYDISLLFVNSKGHVNSQRKAISEFIRRGVDYIAIVPVAIEQVQDLLNEANDKGIQIIICNGNNDITTEKYSFIKSHINNNFYKQGVISAQWFMANNNITNINMLNIVELKDTDNINNSDIRSDGFFDTLIANNINIEKITLETKHGGNSISGITNIINEKIENNKNIDIIFFHNEQTAIDSIGFLMDYNDTINIRNIDIISVGTSKAFFNFIKYGFIDLSVENSPMIGRSLIKTILDLDNKKDIPKLIYVDDGLFDIDVIKNEYSNRPY